MTNSTMPLFAQLQLAQQQLTRFAQGSDFAAVMTTAFGDRLNLNQLQALGQRWQRGDFSDLPAIEVLGQGELAGARGAYGNGRIYLSASFLAQASEAEVLGVLLEEIGHSVDGLLNGDRDALGDEGAIFAELVQGHSLTAAELAVLRAEDDRAWVNIGGQRLVVEQANINGTAGNDSLNGTAVADVIQGLAGNDTINGLGGNDQIIGGQGSDSLTGGTGNDTFALESFNIGSFVSNVDVVTDFVRGQDKVDLRTLGIGDLSTVLAITANDFSNNAVITTKNGQLSDAFYSYSLKLNGIDRGLLTATDFLFSIVTTNDSKLGTVNSDDLFGGLGNDTLNGGEGGDRLFGEQGNDSLVGGLGSDTFYGGLGLDTINLEAFNSSPFTANQDVVMDFVRGQDRVNVSGLGIGDFSTILALTSNDATNSAVITTKYNQSSDVFYSYSLKLNGIDRGLLNPTNFILNTLVVNDSKVGTVNSDDLFGGLGNDTLKGGEGGDRLFGEQGNDSLVGGLGSDTFYGGLGNDTINLEAFNSSPFTVNQDVAMDFVRGQDRVNVSGLGIGDFSTILALTSNDATNSAVITTKYNQSSDPFYSYSLKLNGINRSLLATTNFIFNTLAINDSKVGTVNSDDLFGGLGNDTLNGSDGNDRLFGEQGNDYLNGGLGLDLLVGGAGVDNFVLHRSQGLDTIADFTTGEKLVVSAAEFGGGLVAGALAASQIRVGAGALATSASQRFIFDTTTRFLYFDADGTGVSAGVQIAKLDGTAALSNLSFTVVA